MHFTPRSHFSFHQRRRGFALLVTLVLVAFLVLVLVGLATFTRVETQVADNTQSQAKARQNALAALNIALGKLQETAGPDTRVTATADAREAAAVDGKRHWVGVWDTAATNVAPDEGWLVSGARPGASPAVPPPVPTGAIPHVPTPSPIDTNVTLVGANSADVTGGRVTVPLVPLEVPESDVPGLGTGATPTEIGRIGWWVGDEGVKASTQITDTFTTDPVDYNNTGFAGDDWTAATVEKNARIRQMTLARARLENVFPAPFDPTTGSAPADLQKAISEKQLLLISGAPATSAIRDRFHDLTPLSRAVIAKTSGAGGLKQDRTARVTVDPVTNEIRLFWNTRPASVSGSTATYFVRGGSGAAGETGVGWPYFGVYPVLSEVGIRFYFRISATNRIEMVYFLSAELWNPYPAVLALDPASSDRAFTVAIEWPGDAATRTFVLADGTPPNQNAILTNANRRIFKRVASSVTLQPGSVVELVRSGADELVIAAGTEDENVIDMGAATVTSITSVEIPSLAGMIAKLEIRDFSASPPTVVQTLQQFTLPAFSNVSIASPSVTAPIAGYGYAFKEEWEAWTKGTWGGTLRGKDPRAASIDGTEPEALLSDGSWDQANPGSNNGLSADGLVLGGPARAVLFDLPRQEITSIADYRHIAGRRSYMVGSSWGGDANQRFDDEFVSTVPHNFDWVAAGHPARPNRFLDVFRPEQAAAGTLANFRELSESARFQLIRGAFNVNSSSFDAWEAILGNSISGWDYPDGPRDLNNVFFRANHNGQAIGDILPGIPPVPTSADIPEFFPPNDSDDRHFSAVGRQVSTAEIRTLAERIVARIKLQPTPFRSLAEFVNSGVVQAAIDDSMINNAIPAKQRYTSSALTQPDVLALIAPFMTARSDTFRIRTYADVRNPVTGEVTARAWCEALVQRIPDLAEAPTANIATVRAADPATYRFGRRFKVISFRWLFPEDI